MSTGAVVGAKEGIAEIEGNAEGTKDGMTEREGDADGFCDGMVEIEGESDGSFDGITEIEGDEDVAVVGAAVVALDGDVVIGLLVVVTGVGTGVDTGAEVVGAEDATTVGPAEGVAVALVGKLKSMMSTGGTVSEPTLRNSFRNNSSSCSSCLI